MKNNIVETIKNNKLIKSLEEEIRSNYKDLVEKARRKPFSILEVSDVVYGIEDKIKLEYLDFIPKDLEVYDESLLFGVCATLHDDKEFWSDYVFINIPLCIKSDYTYMEQEENKFKSVTVKNFNPFITDTRKQHTLFTNDSDKDIEHIYPYFLFNIPIRRTKKYNIEYLVEIFE